MQVDSSKIVVSGWLEMYKTYWCSCDCSFKIPDRSGDEVAKHCVRVQPSLTKALEQDTYSHSMAFWHHCISKRHWRYIEYWKLTTLCKCQSSLLQTVQGGPDKTGWQEFAIWSCTTFLGHIHPHNSTYAACSVFWDALLLLNLGDTWEPIV